MVVVAGEITTQVKIHYDKFVRGVAEKIGLDSYVADLPNVDTNGLCLKTCEVLVRINKQCLDIAGGGHVDKEHTGLGQGCSQDSDQGQHGHGGWCWRDHNAGED